MNNDGGYKLRMAFRFILTIIPVALVLYMIDTIAKIYYHSSLVQILNQLLKSIGM